MDLAAADTDEFFPEKQSEEDKYGHVNLPTWRRVLFGAAEFTKQMSLGIQGFFVVSFLLEVALIPASYVGTMMLVRQAWDAITDPVIGVLSDVTRTRFGRRKPYMWFGLFPAAILWIAAWWSPRFIENNIVLAVYFTVILLLLSLMKTFIFMPYAAMAPDMCSTQEQRLSIVLYENLWGMAATVISTFFWASTIVFFPSDSDPNYPNYQKGYLVAAVISTVVGIIPPVLITLFASKERKVPDHEAGTNPFRVLWNMLKEMVQLLKFLPFILVVIFHFLCYLSLNLYVQNFYLFAKYCVGETTKAQYILLIQQVCALFSFFAWAFIAKLLGNFPAFVLGAGLSLMNLVVYFFLEEDMFVLFCILAAWRGLTNGVCFLIPNAVLLEVIDMDEKKTGIRREGTIYALQLLMEKLVLAGGQTLSTYVLGWSGYVTPPRRPTGPVIQPDSALWALRSLTCAAPAFCLLLAIVVMSLIHYVFKKQRAHQKSYKELVDEKKSLLEIVEDESKKL